MAEYAIDFNATCRDEPDGSKTVMVTISGLPDFAMANKVSNWLRDCIRENAHKIGRREPAATQQ